VPEAATAELSLGQLPDTGARLSGQMETTQWQGAAHMAAVAVQHLEKK